MLEKKEIIEILKNILRGKENILFAYLFGSFVEGEAFRDIDIGVYLAHPEEVDTTEFEFSLERELENILPFSFDVRVLNQAPLGFVYSVLLKRILLLDRDPDRRAEFESLVLREYFDFQHLLWEYLREVKSAPL